MLAAIVAANAVPLGLVAAGRAAPGGVLALYVWEFVVAGVIAIAASAVPPWGSVPARILAVAGFVVYGGTALVVCEVVLREALGMRLALDEALLPAIAVLAASSLFQSLRHLKWRRARAATVGGDGEDAGNIGSGELGTLAVKFFFFTIIGCLAMGTAARFGFVPMVAIGVIALKVVVDVVASADRGVARLSDEAPPDIDQHR